MAMACVLKIRFASVLDRTCFRFQRDVLNSDIRDDSEFREKKISIGYILHEPRVLSSYIVLLRLNVVRQLTRRSLYELIVMI